MRKTKFNDGFIPITDDFMFCTVMEDRDRCKEFLQRVLKIEISEIEVVTSQKSIRRRIKSRGVRLDIYVKDTDGNSYDIEMQTAYEPFLAKRTRYYHSEMDGYLLRKGVDFEKLGKNIVIFICTFDPFGLGESIYTFESCCVNHAELRLGDGVSSVFLNINGDNECIDNNLTNVLEYLRTGKTTDDFTRGLHQEVMKYNNDRDWRDNQVTLEMKYRMKYRMGFDDGAKQGQEQARRDIITKLLLKGFSTAEISEIVECDEEEVKKLSSTK
ncbi:MAG: Rpn family recombination-promoting nuclease/putative transposase [Lachnospiraceae bacterium]|nr:Rpn family recombination-promoting nuclease/putative transposase [Lachnospiraceae bacterium]